MSYKHVTVLLAEALRYLEPRPEGSYVDCTAGGGGHAEAIARVLGPAGRLVALDRDPLAVQATRERLQPFGERIAVLHRSFGELEEVLREAGIAGVDGVLFDLGVSSPQLDEPERGFSYRQDGPLDMRMDSRREGSAADLVNCLPEKSLAGIIRRYGEDPFAGRIAWAIAREREKEPFQNTLRLAEVVREAVPHYARREGGHPARRTFQALRIAVNDELGELKAGLDAALRVVLAGGRVVVISFHSLEDRIVKETFRREAHPCHCPPRMPCVCGLQPKVKLLTPKLVRPDEAEVEANLRARGAKLRAALII